MNQTLYQKDSSDRIRSWQIEVIQHSDSSDIVISTGLLDGAKVKTVTQITEGKNIGKSNGTDHYSQAILEANSKIESQLKKGYVKDFDNIQSKDVLGSGVLAPMLAHKHHPTGAQKSSKTLAQMGILGKKIFCQPKLDGNRCLIKVENGVATMYTRSGDVMPVQLKNILDDVLKGRTQVESFILDGELFSNKFSFNKLNGLIKRQTVSKEDIEERKNIKYHLYDVMTDEGYEKRYDFIKNFASDNIEVIPNFEIIATDENIQKYLEQFLAAGNEGLMIRQLGMPYDHKRSWQLVKVKVFEDEEFELIGFEEDKRKGFVGAFVMLNKDGNTFNAGASGQGEQERTYMWSHPEEFIGKMATVCYFGMSEYNVPRFPKFKGPK